HERPCSTSRPYASRLTRSNSTKRRAATKPTVRSLRVADRARDEILEQRDLEVVEVARRRTVDGAAPREHRGVRRLRLARDHLLDRREAPRHAVHRAPPDT